MPNAPADHPASVAAPRDTRASAPSYTGEMPVSTRTVATIAVMAATLMEVLDTSIVNVALPDMQGNFGATLDQIGWVSTGYIIANVIVLPLTGWLSDLFGRRRYLAYSVVLFTFASLGCGISRSLYELVAFRVLQGAGGAAFLSTAQATLLEIYPKRLQGFAQAMFGIGVVMAPTLGPTVGGIITDRYTWPWIFLVNIPVGAVATVLTLGYVPDSAAAGVKRGADFLGISLLALGLGSLQTILERGERDDWFRANYIVALAVTSVFALVLFVWWELRAKSPAVDLRVLKNRNLLAGTVWAFALGFVLYGGVFILPQFFQTILGHTAEQSGLLLMPGGIATTVVLLFLGRVVGKIDVRPLIGTGMLLVALSMWMLARVMAPDAPDSALVWPQVVRGAGIGLQFVPLSLAALGTLPPNKVSEGSGLYNLFRQLGGSFGIAILATILDRRLQLHGWRLAEHLDAYHPEAVDRVAQVQGALVARGIPAQDAQTTALAVMQRVLRGQAALLTYEDIFRIMGYVAVAALALLFLFQRARRTGAPAAVH